MIVTRVKNFRRIGLVFLSLVLFLGCGDASTSVPKAGDVRAENADVGDRAATHDEAVDFAEAFATAVHDNELERINDLIDWHAIIVESTSDVDASEEARKSFVERSFELISQRRVEESLVTAASNGSFDILHVRAVGEDMTVLFRIIDAEGGVNYCELPIVTTSSGKTRAKDIYHYSLGERMSVTTRKSFEMIASTENDSPTSREIVQYVEHHEEFLEMLRMVKNGEGERAYEIYAEMPPVLQSDNKVLIVRIQAALLLDDERYLAAIEEFHEMYPHDPAADFYAIDGHVLRERYQLALAALDSLDQKVGGDPYLDVLRANVCCFEGSFGDAVRFAKRAADAEPGLEEAFWSLADSLLKQKRFAEAVEPLSVLEQQFGVEIGDETFDDYPDFVESSEYQDWKEKRSVRAAETSSAPGN